MMSETFLETIDRNLTGMGFSDRASFLRQAAKEKLESSGISVPIGDALPPSRAGKGGRKSKIVPMILDQRVAEDDQADGLPPRKVVDYRKGSRSKN